MMMAIRDGYVMQLQSWNYELWYSELLCIIYGTPTLEFIEYKLPSLLTLYYELGFLPHKHNCKQS